MEVRKKFENDDVVDSGPDEDNGNSDDSII